MTDQSNSRLFDESSTYQKHALDSLTRHAQGVLETIGEDLSRPGLLKTPERIAKAQLFLTQGYQQDPIKILQEAVFEESYGELVLIKDIEFFSMCEHHMLPFFGVAHVAYLPKSKIVGLSKIPRVVDVFARRLQAQERLTKEILGAIETALNPKGVAVYIEASHLCMMMRGVEKQNSSMVTSSMLGKFRSNASTRSEFLSLIKQ